ncbi:sterol desaturase family protein [Dokdonella soli]|uniref:Sterol desaturase family protein n=1 Tax=Dokdonella soli TaxID=529810 RepID=A0ABN1IFM1_9GAMM
MFDWLATVWTAAARFIAVYGVTPVLAFVHLDRAGDDALEIAQYLLICVVQIAVIALVFRPLESLVPVERWADRRLTRIDRAYTFLKLFGLIPLFAYVFLPLLGTAVGMLTGTPRMEGGVSPLQLDVRVPWFRSHPVALFVAYFTISDFVYYLVHRLQHALPWWWALHSLHHSQRQLSCWSNDRDSIPDDFLEATIIAGVAQLIGVAPVQYALLILLGELLQNFSHANVRLRFGRVIDKLLVDPPYHRLHHMVGDPARPGLQNCNFSFVFPVWDIVFGTALYGEPARPCGVADAGIDADNELGLVAQQGAALRRFLNAIGMRASRDVAAPPVTRHSGEGRNPVFNELP